MCKFIYEVAHFDVEFREEVRVASKHWILYKSLINLILLILLELKTSEECISKNVKASCEKLRAG